MFIKTIRTGKVGGVRQLNHIMLWKYFRNMTDEDLKSIFAYLGTLKPVQHRVDNTESSKLCKLCRGVHGFGERKLGNHSSQIGSVTRTSCAGSSK